MLINLKVNTISQVLLIHHHLQAQAALQVMMKIKLNQYLI